MPFSHHSHSGQFCPGHAKDQLEETIQTAIGQEMRVFCLSEHMPREKIDFYPEEVSLSNYILRGERGLTLPVTDLHRGRMLRERGGVLPGSAKAA